MTERAKPSRRKALKADYKGATPEQVAKALHRYRPKKAARETPKGRAQEGATVNPSL